MIHFQVWRPHLTSPRHSKAAAFKRWVCVTSRLSLGVQDPATEFPLRSKHGICRSSAICSSSPDQPVKAVPGAVWERAHPVTSTTLGDRQVPSGSVCGDPRRFSSDIQEVVCSSQRCSIVVSKCLCPECLTSRLDLMMPLICLCNHDLSRNLKIFSIVVVVCRLNKAQV